MTQIIDPHHFNQQARQIKAHVSAILTKWGLMPRFKRWRLTQDPDTGIVVLFGILNNKYIAAHTPTPFSDYFDPRLLQDLANELQVQVVSCNSDGLRYAFVLDRGHLGELQTHHIDFPFMGKDKLSAGVVYSKSAQPAPDTPLVDVAIVDDHAFVSQVADAFVKVFDEIKLKDEAALQLAAAAQNLPNITVINEDEFHKRVAEHEVNRQKVKRISKLLRKSAVEK